MKIAITLLALYIYGCITWGSFFFFKAENEGSKTGKGIVSLLAGVAIVSSVVVFASSPTPSMLQMVFTILTLALSNIIYWWAINTNKDQPLDYAFSSSTPAHIVTAGPYKFMRNPFYTSYLLSWIAPLIFNFNPFTLCVFMSMLSLFWYLAVKEENLFLNSDLAKKYEQYMLQAGRFLPKLISF
jgi:protein-S-isoprenylcysteine O-methyltransferase Ste14